MSFLRTIFSSIGLADSPEAHAAKKKAKWIETAAEVYSVVAAGAAINRKCKILAPKDGAKFEQDFERFTSALAGKLHPNFMKSTRETAERLAAGEPYSQCGTKAREAVAEAQRLVAAWLNRHGIDDMGWRW